MKVMTDDELAPVAEFYGVSIEQARENNRKCVEQAGNPLDPICVGCAKRPDDCGYQFFTEEGQTATEYVIAEEGTYNRENGHFLCDSCYIKNGSPSSPRGWKCP